MKHFFVRKLGSLRPATEEAEEALRRIPEGEMVQVDISRPRNLKHHKKFYALCTVIANNTDGYTKDTVKDLFAIATGFYTPVKTRSGIEKIPKSISFANMDQSEFELFYDKCILYACEEIIPGLSDDDLRAELEAFAQ